MRTNYKGINIVIMPSYEALSQIAANILVSQVILKPDSILGLATGGTPVGMYAEIVRQARADAIDFSEITTYNLDEYYPIDKGNEQSYAYYMKQHLFSHINIDLANVHIPSGETDDIEAECRRYDQAIYDAGGIDLQVLGIGHNGHIGFNEPDVRFEQGTHRVTLDEETVKANARFFDSIDKVPHQAISMGIRTIMHSRKIILLANGIEKAEIIEEAIFGDITPKVPASVLQLHQSMTFILDEKAASKIKSRL